MAYTPPNGASVSIEYSVEVYARPAGGNVNLEFDPTFTATIRSVGAIPAPSNDDWLVIGNQAKNVYPAGIPPPTFPTNHTVEKEAQKIFPTGIDAPVMPDPALIYRQDLFVLSGIAPPENNDPITRIRVAGGYNGPPADSVILDFRIDSYSPPPATSTILEFGVEGFSKILGVSLGDQSAVGSPTLYRPQSLDNVTMGDQSAIGNLTIQIANQQVVPQGIPAPALPTGHTVSNLVQLIAPIGIAPPSFPVNHSVSYTGNDLNSMNFMLLMF